MSNEPNNPSREPLAIVGIGCRFPKADSLEAFWSNIRRGVDAITEIPESHWDPAAYFDADKSTPDMTYAKRGGFIDPVDFNPMEFGVGPVNIEATDTTQLLGMLVARDALRDAGYATSREATDGRAFDRDRCSVILGVTGTLELVIPLGARLGHPIWRKALAEAGVDGETAEDVVQRIADGYVPWQENSFPGLLGNVAAGRIANRLDTGGTNCVVDAACASSLGAVHMAAMELWAGRSDMAITGGLDTFNDIFMYMCFSKTPALSPTGNSRPFDRDGDGTILGEGLGVVVLKRLSDAQRDGDKVYCVLRSIGSSSDGKGNAVYAPSAKGQAKALRVAYREAGVSPDTIELIEAHGTGTKVGDAVELTALSEVYREAKGDGTWAAVGSVKSMIGHTKAAAGVAGLIKAAMALRHKVLPPTIKVANPLDVVKPGDAPMYINAEQRPWVRGTDAPRRAALSAFGFGGSNFHAVLEEAPAAQAEPAWDGRTVILPLHADTRDALLGELDRIDTTWDWPRLRGEAARHRAAFDAKAKCRLVLVIEKDDTDLGKLLDKAREQIRNPKSAIRNTSAFFAEGTPGKLGVLFPGQGSQRIGMLRDLACQFPAALDALGAADAAYGPATGARHGERLSDRIYPITVFDDAARAAQDAALRDTSVAQPALGAVSAGAWDTLRQFGVSADAFAGHSFGELVALHAAGRIDAGTLHRLAVARGRAMADAANAGGDTGAMLAAFASADQLRQIIEQHKLDVVLANDNAPTQVVLSGPTDAIDRAATVLADAGIRAKRLEVAAAFHSRLVADAETKFAAALADIDLAGTSPNHQITTSPNRGEVYANTTGDRYPADADEAKRLLAAQLANPVKFVDSIRAMHAAGVRTFVEVGPGAVLTGLVGAILGDADHTAIALDASRGKRSGQHDLALLLARLASLGYAVDLTRWDTPASAIEIDQKKPGMTVKLTGANYVTPREPRPPRPRTASKVDAAKPQAAGASTHSTTQATPAMDQQSASNRPSSNPLTANALAATQQSLLALQQMQQQAAELHRQYLEGQQATQHAIAQLIAQQQALLGGAPLPAVQMPVAPAPVAKRQAVTEASAPSREPLPQSVPGVAGGGAPFAPVAEAKRQAVTEASAPSREPLPQSVPGVVGGGAVDVSRFRDALLAVVADKTGYPVEMLELDMSLDADLGIDSIKRVEILSAFQERVPDAPAVKPDDLGRLQTLRQIVDFMGAAAGAADASDAKRQAVAEASAPSREPLPQSLPGGEGGGGVDVSRFRDALLAVVADKTGYPVEMLELDMSLDADLGIDSIKRVEILSAFQERAPDAPAVKPDDLGRLQTLRQIVEFMGDATQASAPSREPLPRSLPGVVGGGAVDVSRFRDALLAVVADKTGYPVEMLELDMSLDADLGIDSIKRVEILSAFQERVPDAPAVKPDDLGRLQTLRQIVEFMGDAAEASAPSREPLPRSLPGGEGGSPTRVEVVVEPPKPARVYTADDLDRRVLVATPFDPHAAREHVELPEGAAVWVTDDGTELTHYVCASIKSRGLHPEVVALNHAAPNPDARPVAGLVLLAPAKPASTYVADAFGLLQRVGASLRECGKDGAALLACVTRFDGTFMLNAQAEPAADVTSAGLAGLVKTASHEWPEVHCKVIDAAPGRPDLQRLGEHVVMEMLAVGPIEVGVGAGPDARVALELRDEKISDFGSRISDLKGELGGGDVIVVTGGARGVTAEVAVALAETYGVTLALLGRSPDPKPEPAWLADAHDDASIKKAIIAHLGGKVTPKKVEERFRPIVANRQINETLRRIEAAGGAAVYRSVDVRNAVAVAKTLDGIRNEHGPIRGLVHGAGVLADKLIEDKTAADFASVWSTKVDGLRALLAATSKDDLRVMVLFGSSTGRFGRRGQADYAAANELLNKLAQREARRRPGCRVVSVNWGPWDGGMVTPELKKVFAAEGVSVIPLAAGAAYLTREIATDVSDAAASPVEVVLLGPREVEEASGADAGTRSGADRAEEKTIATPVSASMHVALRREVSVESCPVLASHVMNGRAVLPTALMIEWMAHAAIHDNPGLGFAGFDDLRVLKGVIVEPEQATELRVLKGVIVEPEQATELRVFAGPAEVRGEADVVPVELRSGDGGQVLHARASIVLSNTLESAAASSAARPTGAYAHADHLYADARLFHGPDLHAIDAVEACGAAGIVTRVHTAPAPGEWLRQPLRASWIADPLVLDGAFQSMILWTQETRGVGSLPTGAARYRQFQRDYPTTGPMRIVIRVTDRKDHAATADIELLDANGSLVGRIEGYTCVIDASLNEAFTRNQLPQRVGT
ncbi:MAG: SDR family NAD(P)-dependent oxidoreductase [Phycisphaera sp.]|nr:SDR family NAD(P)-dependent oxidoreductase [Phycisphaera sp.]